LQVCDGLYEGHVNYFIAAQTFDDAKIKVKSLDEFMIKKMHVDGIQEVQLVNGYKVNLILDQQSLGQTKIVNFKHRELASLGKSK